MRLVLASGSPRRAELLAAAGFHFDIIRADVDESLHANEAAPDYVVRLARLKSARAIQLLSEGALESERAGDWIVIGADTVVVVDGAILGKPDGDDGALAMLRRLSGRTHQVMTGVSVSSAAGEIARLETTAVWFSPLSAEELAWYVSTGEGRDKAGAYAIQGLASRFIPRIEGSYSNVVGLPVALVADLLRRLPGAARPARG